MLLHSTRHKLVCFYLNPRKKLKLEFSFYIRQHFFFFFFFLIETIATFDHFGHRLHYNIEFRTKKHKEKGKSYVFSVIILVWEGSNMDGNEWAEKYIYFMKNIYFILI